jgi:hypothetical protein
VSISVLVFKFWKSYAFVTYSILIVESNYDAGVVDLWLYEGLEFSILVWKVFDEAFLEFEGYAFVKFRLALCFTPAYALLATVCVRSFVVDELARSETVCSSRLSGHSLAPSADRRSCLHCYRSSTLLRSMDVITWRVRRLQICLHVPSLVQRFALLYQYRACHACSSSSLCSRTRHCPFYYRVLFVRV